MSNEEAMLALLLWSVDASESEWKSINVTRDDAIRLMRSFEAELSDGRRDALTAIGRAVLLSYRHGQMDGPRST